MYNYQRQNDSKDTVSFTPLQYLLPLNVFILAFLHLPEAVLAICFHLFLYSIWATVVSEFIPKHLLSVVTWTLEKCQRVLTARNREIQVERTLDTFL